MPKFIKVTRSDNQGGYIQSLKEAMNIIDGEFDDIEDMPVGTTVHLTVVEMTQEEYDNLGDFQGW